MAAGLFCASSILCKRRLVPHSESAGQTEENFHVKRLADRVSLKSIVVDAFT